MTPDHAPWPDDGIARCERAALDRYMKRKPKPRREEERGAFRPDPASREWFRVQVLP